MVDIILLESGDELLLETGTEEVRRVCGKTELVNRKENLEKQLVNVNELLAVFD